MKYPALVLVITILLIGCAGPKVKQANLDKKATPCLEGQDSLDLALSCLKSNGYRNWREHKNTFIYDSCGLYWGYPLVASCSYIFIEHEGNSIKSFKVEAALDGV